VCIFSSVILIEVYSDIFRFSLFTIDARERTSKDTGEKAAEKPANTPGIAAGNALSFSTLL
jgi:hypothetical protein